MARLLTIDDATRAKIERVLAHAQAHPYRPGGSPPGDDPRFVAHLDSYRAVFSFTHSDGLVWRHLSISVPSSQYPNPAPAFSIAKMFGFTGSPVDWLIDINQPEHCIIMAQALESEIDKAAAH